MLCSYSHKSGKKAWSPTECVCIIMAVMYMYVTYNVVGFGVAKLCKYNVRAKLECPYLAKATSVTHGDTSVHVHMRRDM